VTTIRHQGNFASEKHTNLRHREIILQKIKGEKKKEMRDIKIFFVFLGLTQKHLMGRSHKM